MIKLNVLAVQFAQHCLVTSLEISAWLILGCNFIGLSVVFVGAVCKHSLFFFGAVCKHNIIILLLAGVPRQFK